MVVDSTLDHLVASLCKTHSRIQASSSLIHGKTNHSQKSKCDCETTEETIVCRLCFSCFNKQVDHHENKSAHSLDLENVCLRCYANIRQKSCLFIQRNTPISSSYIFIITVQRKICKKTSTKSSNELTAHHDQEHIHIINPVFIANVNCERDCGIKVRSSDWSTNKDAREQCESDSELTKGESICHVYGVKQHRCAHKFVKEDITGLIRRKLT